MSTGDNELVAKIVQSVAWPTDKVTITGKELNTPEGIDRLDSLQRLLRIQKAYVSTLLKQARGETTVAPDADAAKHPQTIEEHLRWLEKDELSVLYVALKIADGPSSIGFLMQKIRQDVKRAIAAETGIESIPDRP